MVSGFDINCCLMMGGHVKIDSKTKSNDSPPGAPPSLRISPQSIEQMRPSSFTMSAAAVIALTAATSPRTAHAFRANASGLARSLSHLIGGGSKTCEAPQEGSSSKPAFDTSRTGVKRGLFSKLFGGMSEGIDYSSLKGVWLWEMGGGGGIDVAFGGQSMDGA